MGERFDKFMRSVFIVDMIVMFLLIGFLAGTEYSEWKTKQSEVNVQGKILTNVTDYMECGGNLTLKETSYCLVKYVNGFYNYTIRNDTVKTLEDIKENGGDCYDYSLLYKSFAEELNITAYNYDMYHGDFGHRIAVLMDDDGYCVLDQIAKPTCYKLGFNDDEQREPSNNSTESR